MLAVLVGIINRTNWKKPNTQRGSFSITVQESEHPQQDKRGRTNTERPFFLSVHPKGKESQQPQPRPKDKPQSQAGKQATKQSRRAGRKQDKRTKEENERQNTQQAPKPPNHSRVQKPHKPRKAPRQYKPTQQPQTTLKTP